MKPATNVYVLNTEGKRFKPLTRYYCPVPGCNKFFYNPKTVPKHLDKDHKEDF